MQKDQENFDIVFQQITQLANLWFKRDKDNQKLRKYIIKLMQQLMKKPKEMGEI